MRIVHVLGMVIGCALAFATYRGLISGLRLRDSWRAFAEFYVIVMGGAVGVMLAGGLTLARRWWQGDATMMSQPGHWLLAFGLAVLLANGGATGAYYGWYYVAALKEVIRPPFWMPFHEAWTPTAPGIIHQAVCWGLTGTAALVLCVMSLHLLRWDWWAFFLIFVLCAAYMCAGYIAAFVDLWGRAAAMSWCSHAAHLCAKVIVLCSLIVVLATVRDVRRGNRGDFLHWTGILVWSVVVAVQLSLYYEYTLRSVPVMQAIGIMLIP